MALNKKNTNNTCTSVLLLLSLVIFSQFLASHGRPLPTGSYITTAAAVHGRNLLSHGSGSVPKGMLEGTVSPSSEIHGDNGSMVGADDVRPSNPGHSPGIGHAFINEKGTGRKL
ncbi:hypothetical protein BDA96_01G371800 [Sorghum bicolor]|uniref:Uncharacterized protein n=2 Tax=Sorghum bicolor TaxID=4558 RepID=C5WXM9_SORBI|nr:hypothetical protein SORBI_3001G348500 [Sorghum bicolor]KAG0550835.1 hypothetical protein BDA96_01G371800 [Sorghum bicolor]